jgi:hypothetical protein
MAKSAKRISKGKPSGNKKEHEGWVDPFDSVDPGTDAKITDEYMDDETGEPADNVPIKHHNRHLHKGESLETFKDLDEDDD